MGQCDMSQFEIDKIGNLILFIKYCLVIYLFRLIVIDLCLFLFLFLLFRD